LVDTKRLNLLSFRDSIYSSEIAQLENKLKELSAESLKFELTKNEILQEEEHIRKMQADFLNKKQRFVTTKGDLRVSLDLKRKEKE